MTGLARGDYCCNNDVIVVGVTKRFGFGASSMSNPLSEPQFITDQVICSREKPSTIILLNGYSNKLALSSYLYTQKLVYLSTLI